MSVIQKILCSAGATFMLSCALLATEPETALPPYESLTGTILNQTTIAGDVIRVRIYSKARTPWFFHGTRLFVYRKDAVPGCFEKAGLKIEKNAKSAGYDSVELAKWDWFPRKPEAEIVREFSTANWLPGKYVIYVHALYYPEKGNQGYVFAANSFELNLLEAVEK